MSRADDVLLGRAELERAFTEGVDFVWRAPWLSPTTPHGSRATSTPIPPPRHRLGRGTARRGRPGSAAVVAERAG